jgi:hypothetical protein
MVQEVSKLCPGCNTVKSHFPLSNRRATRHGIKTYLKTRCRDCTSHDARIACQLRKLFAAPPPFSPCECCARSPERLFLDHDHRTELFRGWLCRECNSGLGFLGDNAEGLARATMYLNA